MQNQTQAIENNKLKNAMKDPVVSVRIVTYNQAPYITRTIEKALCQQTTFPFEVVIGEDCSTDGTREIVLDYQKRYPDVIRVITSDENVGCKRNAYRTSKACRGKYIAYCDGDDVWHHPEKLQLQVDYLESHADCGMVFSDCHVHYVMTGKTIEFRYRSAGLIPPVQPDGLSILKGRCRITTSTVCARRALVINIIDSDPFLFQTGHLLMSDTPLWVELSKISRLHYLDQALVTRNVLPESATQSQDKTKVRRFWLSNAEMCLYMAEKHSMPMKYIESFRTKFHRDQLRLAFDEQDMALGQIARQHLSPLSLREKGLYWGSQNYILNKILKIGQRLWWCIKKLPNLLPRSVRSN